MKQPVEPNKDDCCGSGCNPCIFDIYDKHMKQYKLLKIDERVPETFENGISQISYTTFIVLKVIHICDLHNFIFFKRLDSEKKSTCKVHWNPGEHFLLKYTSDVGSCTRPYTPIKLKNDSRTCNEFDFSVIVKKYDNGFVSRYLYNLRPGEKTLWRGPYGDYQILRNQYKRVIMLAQGTGIAPFISIIDSILNDEDNITKIVLYYCCASEDKILLRDQLYEYKSYWNFTYKIFLSRFIAVEKYKYQEPIINEKLKYENLFTLRPFTSYDQCLVCGSTQFMMDFCNLLQKESVKLQNIILF